MKVLIGATAVWLIISAIIAWTILLIATKGPVWPLLVALVATSILIKKVACDTH